MSKIVNNKGFKPGSIYRIALENFVTYKQVVLFPGPSLNMIIGPNGTGKSTFVCAVILGLCGKTSVIGRAKKISEYVRSGCEHANIEIELYQHQGERNVIITRHFNLKDVTTWYIDNKSVREKQVQDLIASLNIQVDNLCQLLPQDRVQDFSKMDPQQLLRSTLSAVGGQESVDQLDELIESRNQQRGVSTKLLNNAQLIQEQERLNERLKVAIDAMKQRKEIEKQIEICEKKKLWLEYQELREKVIEYTNDKKQAVTLVSSHKTKMAPLEKVIEKAKAGISKLEQQKMSATREIHTLKEKAKEIINTVREHEYTLKDIDASFQDKLERHRNREQELVEARAKLEKLVTDKERLVEKVGDESQVKMEMAEIVKALAKTKSAMDVLKKQKLEIQYDLENNIMPQIRLYQNRIRNLEDVDNKRLEVLRNYSEDAYKAVMWLRQNNDMFQHPVYEPMMLEINFTDPKFARYLESTVSARDLVAFTFESSQDMNLFLQKVRQEGGLKRVNAICCSGRPNVQKNNVQQISYLGFYTYLVDTITAPDPIIKYLCKQYNIHKIPIGNEHTYNNSGRVPANITYFFTENHRFTVRVSAYSGAKSSSTIEIRPARLLANTVDVDQLENCNQQLIKFDSNAKAHKSKIQTLDEKISTIEVTVNELNTKRKNINDGVEKVRTINAQIRVQTQKVRDIENEATFDIQKERELCRKKQKECVLKQCSLHRQLVEVMKNLQERDLNGDIWKFFVAGATLLAAISAGGATLYPTVLLQQLKSNESSIHLDFETSTWIGSLHGLAGIPSILIPSMMQWRGRKFAFILACLILASGWIVAFIAQSVASVIVSECLQGFGSSSIFITSLLSISEMVAPQYREMFVQSYFLCQCLMMALSGILFQYLNWKTIAGIMLIPIALALLIAFMWPESPYWLAYKGRISESKRAFVWLRGSDTEASKELENLIYKQRENFILNRNKPTFSIKSLWTTITDKEFYIPAFHMFVLDCQLYWSGVLVMLIYSVDVYTKSTHNENARFYSALIANSMTFCGVFCSIVVNKFISKKTLLLNGTGVVILCLLGASLITFLQNIGFVSRDSLLCVMFYVIYNFISALAMTCTTYPISSSLMPVKYRGIGGAFLIITTSVLHSTSLKFSPYLFVYINLGGTFLVYALNALICNIIVWKFVPDTDGKSLQDIEDFYAKSFFGSEENSKEYELIVVDPENVIDITLQYVEGQIIKDIDSIPEFIY